MLQKLFILSVFIAIVAPSSSSALTLQEKLALAKCAADDAVEGKAEKGQILNGQFDFEAAMKKYASVLRAQKEDSDDFEDAGDAAISAAATMEEELLEAENVKLEPVRGQKDAQESLIGSSPARPKDIRKELSENKKILTVKDDKIIEDSTPSPSESAKTLGGERLESKPSEKFVPVDTSKDFVRGYFTGKIDSKDNTSESEKNLPSQKTPEENVRYYHYDSSIFYMTSDDYQVFLKTLEVVKGVQNVVGSCFGDVDIGRKITLQVSPNAEIADTYDVQYSDNGNVVILIKWSGNLSLDALGSILMESVIRKISLNEGGIESFKKPKKWLNTAMTAALKQYLCAGVARDYARICKENPPPDKLEDLFAYGQSSDISEISLARMYFLIKSLESVVNRRDFHSFMRFITASEFPEKAVLAELEKLGKFPRERWACIFNGEIYARLGGVQDIDDSDSEIARLAVLPTSNSVGERIGVVASDALKFASEAHFTRDAKTRVLEIKVALIKINPLYYNSLVLLGNLYEFAIDGDREGFESSLKEFEAELSRARAISGRVKSLMKEPLPEVKSSDKKTVPAQPVKLESEA